MTELTIRFNASEWERVRTAADRAQEPVEQLAHTAVLKAAAGSPDDALVSALARVAEDSGSRATATMINNILWSLERYQAESEQERREEDDPGEIRP